LIGFPYNGKSEFRVGSGAPNMSEAPENTEILIKTVRVGKTRLAGGREVTDLRWDHVRIIRYSHITAQSLGSWVGQPWSSTNNREVKPDLDLSPLRLRYLLTR
jgi:hypothetical protein